MSAKTRREDRLTPGSHTPTDARHSHDEGGEAERHPQLASSAERGLPEQLAGRLDGHLERFAEHMRQGLLAASTAIGLEVMGELMAGVPRLMAGSGGTAG